MSRSKSLSLSQRADYTHKFNTNLGRHGWLRLTPAYSVRVVEEILSQYPSVEHIFDPFCGTGTTAVSGAFHGIKATSIDINPFLTWLANAKAATYTTRDISDINNACDDIVDAVRNQVSDCSPPPPIFNIHRWWSERTVELLCRLRDAIKGVTGDRTHPYAILWIAFCRVLIESSNAAFNHQSLSFNANGSVDNFSQDELIDRYRAVITQMTTDIIVNPTGSATFLLHDARLLHKLNIGKVDLVVTSPPYANRMSYIRELRPYMYWLDFLASGRDAGELDWIAIGGTWGVATSRLNTWIPPANSVSELILDPIVAKISTKGNLHGNVMSSYIRKYCIDIESHLTGLHHILSKNARVHYIVGNSTFYDVLLPVEQVYALIMKHIGFVDIDIRPIRKRNSKKDLIEFDISATWPI